MNQQYWAKGLLPVTTWLRHSFTSDVGLFPDKLSDLRGALLRASCFLARAEPPLPRWQALAFPFQWDTWVAILLGLVVSGPLLHLLAALGSSW
ncbi:hypothetical protein E2C01_029114 [Portunus trituberculatus]|uniref:Uncharacterized protein n=1 Tax=Portunus trituberculatus TaxID=210409 RepID=A0A5B7EQM6_PORTR|nr:hypothetical protein [Portunus trituberculatus]